MSIQVRRAAASEAPAVSALTRAAYLKWVPVIGREPLPMKADFEAAIKNHIVELLEVEGALVGLIEMIPEHEWLLIENLAVHPEHQGRGHAGFLLKRAAATAVALRLPELRLYTNKLFASNVDLYLRHGFVIDREEPFMNGATVYMSKRLAV